MSPLSKVATAALITATFSSFGGHAGAAPLSSSLALRDAVTPTLQTVQWGGGPYYGYDNDYYCPPYYGSYSSTYYGGYGGYGNYGGYSNYGGYGGYWFTAPFFCLWFGPPWRFLF